MSSCWWWPLHRLSDSDSDSSFSLGVYSHSIFLPVAFSPTQPTHSNNHQNSPEWQHRKCSISRTWLLSAGLQHDLWTCEYFMNQAVPLHASQQKSLMEQPSVWKVAWIRETEEHNFSLWPTVIFSFFQLNQTRCIFKAQSHMWFLYGHKATQSCVYEVILSSCSNTSHFWNSGYRYKKT